MLIQYVEGDIDIVEKMKRTGKYEKCQMRYNIHMEDELNNSRLWLTRNYKEALYHRLDKDFQYDMDNDMDMELQRINLQYGMLNFIIYDNNYSRYFILTNEGYISWLTSKIVHVRFSWGNALGMI